ncbi:hypothetical protein BJY00DRAFT_319063 [Aspergillus carlsbadensis]|nr:hypothetical protein BJY00DRAFT_319063 [Aspergillus carlsbadensis]
MAAESISQDPSPNLSAEGPPRTALPPQVYTAPFRPVVIPQVSKSARSEITIPFLRAYSMTLSPYSIPQADFLTFIDGLNAVWIANPVLQATNIAGQVMGLIHPVEIAGLVVEAVSEVASEGSSYIRTRRYLRKMNKEFFKARGLVVKIQGFKDMLDVIGVSEVWVRGCVEMRNEGGFGEREVGLEELEGLLAGVSDAESEERVHPRLRLMSALEGYVAPLERVHMPVDTKQQSNLLRRLNASFAAKEEQKRTEGLEKKQNEARKRQAEKYQEAIKAVQSRDKEIAKLEERIRMAEEKRGGDDKEARKKIDRLAAEIRKLEIEKRKRVREKLQCADKDLEKLQQKEMEETMKIKWLVVSRLETTAMSGVGV